MLPKYFLITATITTIAIISAKPVVVLSQVYGQRIKSRIISPEVNEKDFRAPYDLPNTYSTGQTESSEFNSAPKITSYSDVNGHHYESRNQYRSDQSLPVVYVPAHYHAERRNDDSRSVPEHYSTQRSVESEQTGYGPTPFSGIFYPQAKHIQSEHHDSEHPPVTTIVIPPSTLNAAIHHSIYSQPIKYSSEHSTEIRPVASTYVATEPKTVATISNAKSNNFASHESEVKHYSDEQSVISKPLNQAALNSGLRSDESYLIHSKPRRNYESTYASYSIADVSADSTVTGENRDEENNSYRAFEFSYDNTDEYGTQMVRAEAGDDSGKVTGTYSYRDINGMARIVRYIADQEGFRAQIQTNEPGTETSNPADAQIISSNPGPHEKPE